MYLDPSSLRPGFYSVYLVEKYSDVWRPTLNLCQSEGGGDSAKFKMDILQSMTSMLGFLGLILNLCLMLTYPSKDRIDRLRRLDVKVPGKPSKTVASFFMHLASMI